MLISSYYYQGYCPQSGELLRLPRTQIVEAIAKGLMEQLGDNELYCREGKMYGVLLVELLDGSQRVLKAFSGLLNGCSVVEGWVPPIPGQDLFTLESAKTLAELEAIKQELMALKQLPQRQQYEKLSSEFERQLQLLSESHHFEKQQRSAKRQQLCLSLTGEALAVALEQLNEESRWQGIERRKFKHKRDAALQPFEQLLKRADTQMRELKQRRKALSRQLQAQMHAAYSLTNFSGQSLSLQQLLPFGSMPSGTGDCCAPKLLHYAATHDLKPLAMAEFWWGSTDRDKVQGEFYGACAERCQPLMGFLLSGLPQRYPLAPSSTSEQTVPILYEDEWLIAVNKPTGLLSVPGRYSTSQDSVLSRLRHLLPDGMALKNVHRLDLETSGILLLARDRQTSSQISRQFQQRQVYKVYEALLAGKVTADEGTIELPLKADLQNRPYQKVDREHGKPSQTSFRVMAREEDCTRVELMPLTGRTHQIRVHAADSGGLGVPILGDRLYGCHAVVSRLHLHARELRFQHPQTGLTLHLQAKTPF